MTVPKRLHIGYFRQDVEEMQGRSVLTSHRGSGPRGRSASRMEETARAMEDPERADELDRILERFGHVTGRVRHLQGYAWRRRPEVLHGCWLRRYQIDGDVGRLSGGWKMRWACAVLLGAGRAADGRATNTWIRIHHLAEQF